MENSLSSRLQSPQIDVFASPVIVKAKSRDLFQHFKSRNITPQIILALLLGSLAFGILAGLCCYFTTNYTCCWKKKLTDTFDEYAKVVVVPTPNKRKIVQPTSFFVKIEEENNSFNKKDNLETPIYNTIISSPKINETRKDSIKEKNILKVEMPQSNNMKIDDFILFDRKDAMKDFETNQNQIFLNTKNLIENQPTDISSEIVNSELVEIKEEMGKTLSNDTKNINLSNVILNTASLPKTITVFQAPKTIDSTKLPQIATLTRVANSATLPKKEAKLIHTNNSLRKPELNKSTNMEKEPKLITLKPTQLIEPKIRSPQYLRSLSSPKSPPLSINKVPLIKSPPTSNKSLTSTSDYLKKPNSIPSPKIFIKRTPSTPPLLINVKNDSTKENSTTLSPCASPRASRTLKSDTDSTMINARSTSQPTYARIAVNNENNNNNKNKLQTATLKSRKKGTYEIIQKPQWK